MCAFAAVLSPPHYKRQHRAISSSGEELDSGAIKDKTSKISYLDKIIALVGICSGHDIDVRPNKVVAGLEPEGTNALLTVSYIRRRNRGARYRGNG